ncbi:MAG: beta-1,6-N-acetylglucosaminyltransferase [Snowella sp.]|nr:beta-1,6-N-acetylglucosaminyltransferase [Snowella sp.]
MKQAILITAYKDFNHLIEMIRFFDDDFYLYIHIDKKSLISKDDIEIIQNANNVVFLSRQFNVNWGGLNHLKSILLLSEEAIKNEDTEYFHIISGQDFPTKSCDYIQDFITKNKGKEFLEFFEIPAKQWSDEEGGMSRIWYFNFYDFFNAKTITGQKIISFLIKIQIKLKFKRQMQQNLPKLFGGSTWWTLSYSCLKYVIDYTKNKPYLLKRFKYTFASEEFFFQTIIMNSPFKDNVVNNNLRYIEWKCKNNSCPAILDDTDFDNIIVSDAIFARKFQQSISEKLIDKIKEYITQPLKKCS